MDIPSLIALISVLSIASGLLITLFVIDIRHFLLPNIYVFPLGLCGVLFHSLTDFVLLSPADMIAGAIVGGGFLYLVRAAGTYYYKQEAMGLGDVKLLISGGIWLGPSGVLFAIIAGAGAGIIHGILIAAYISIKNKTPFNIKRLIIPAGPGFIIGLIATFWLYNGAYISTWIMGAL
jgi:leader peptidase (prepilin peptidase)/N-methyltransferase